MNMRLPLFAIAALSLIAQTAPTAESILDHFVEVTGGKAAWEKVHSEVSKGRMEFTAQGISGSVVSYEAEPNLNYISADLQGVGKVESGTDGDVFWERSAMTGARIKNGAEREEILRASIFNPHLNWRKIYEKAELAGSETIDGEDCYKIVLTPKSGRPDTEYYSKTTGLLVKTQSVHQTQMGDIPAEQFFKDYRKVGDLLVPFTHLNRFAGQEIAIHLDSVEFNTGIPKDRFQLPDEVKALVRKSGESDEKK